MTFKLTLIIATIAMILGAGLDHYFSPPKTKEITKDVIHTEVQTVTKIVHLPSGEVDTTITTDKDITDTLTAIKTQTASIPKNYLLSGSYGIDLHTMKPSYGVDLKYRALGPFFIGGEYTFDGTIRGTLGMEF